MGAVRAPSTRYRADGAARFTGRKLSAWNIGAGGNRRTPSWVCNRTGGFRDNGPISRYVAILLFVLGMRFDDVLDVIPSEGVATTSRRLLGV